MAAVRTIGAFARSSTAPRLFLRNRNAAVSFNRGPSAVRTFAVSSASWKKLYTRDHEWIELDSDGTTGTIGISTYAAKALGDVVFIELPQLETEVKAGDTLGAVESVKSASDILSPVAGTVLEVNSSLEDKPQTINASPEGEGWLCKMKVESPEELHELMDKDAYDVFTGDEAS